LGNAGRLSEALRQPAARRRIADMKKSKAPARARKPGTDWRRRFDAAKPPKVVEPGSPLAKRLSCDSRWLEEQRAAERG
jgi:hypothetical protein